MLKKNSRLALRGNWGKAIGMLCIMCGAVLVLSVLQQVALSVLVISPAISNPTMEAVFPQTILNNLIMNPLEYIITGVTLLITLLLVQPLWLGITGWYYALVRGISEPVASMFRFFDSAKSYGRAVHYNLQMLLRSYFWAIVYFLLPSGVLGASLYYIGISDGGEVRLYSAIGSVGILLSCVLFLLAFVLYATFMCRYQLTPYLLCSDEDLTVRAAIKRSIAATKGHRFSLFLYSLSFIGWGLLLMFIAPILYVYPYYSAALAMYSCFIIEKSNAPVDEVTREFAKSVPVEPVVTITPPAEEEAVSPADESPDPESDNWFK